MKKRRNGFALIYTVLIGALVLISIVGLSIKTIPEDAITKARIYSQRALLTAEAGASQVLFDLRSFGTDENTPNDFNPDSGDSHYLSKTSIINLMGASENQIISIGEKEFQVPTDDAFKAIYESKIKILSNDEEEKKLNVDLYVLGTVKDRSNEGKILSRKAIVTNFDVKYNIELKSQQIETRVWIPGTPSAIFDYALFSGGDILFGGSAQTVNGSIHAVGTIDLGNAKNQVRVGGEGDAEAEQNIVGKGIVTGKSIPSAPPVPFPEIDPLAYKPLADAFRSGQAPYDGSSGDYPNVNNPLLLSVIQTYLGAPGTSSTLEGIKNFYNDLKNGTGLIAAVLNPVQIQELRTKAKSIVYYIEGDVHINGQFECIGTLVINGDLIINGNSQIGDPLDAGAAAILVNGDIDLSNGTADLYGLFYSTGALRGSGTFYCEGSIATEGTIDVRGNYTVDYREITNPNLSVDQPGHWEITYQPGPTVTYYSIISAAGAGFNYSEPSFKYTWKEVSYEEFDNL